jgi:hypothetical protein
MYVHIRTLYNGQHSTSRISTVGISHKILLHLRHNHYGSFCPHYRASIAHSVHFTAAISRFNEVQALARLTLLPTGVSERSAQLLLRRPRPCIWEAAFECVLVGGETPQKINWPLLCAQPRAPNSYDCALGHRGPSYQSLDRDIQFEIA